jgi:wee1-like protein kinase
VPRPTISVPVPIPIPIPLVSITIPSPRTIGSNAVSTNRAKAKQVPPTPSPVKTKSVLGQPTTFASENPYSPLKQSTASSLESLNVTRYEREFEHLAEIGCGSFGTVHKCQHRIDGWVYAIKKSNDRLNTRAELKQRLKEVYALAALPAHSNIVRYYNSWLEEYHLFIQTEFCEGGTLQDYQENLKDRLSEQEAIDIMRQIASGLAHMHAHQMVHLDVKPENVYRSHGVWKIGDFGLSDSVASTTHQDGDNKYLAREMLDESQLALPQKCDVFSLGASIYELLCNSPLPPYGPAWHELRNGNIVFPDDVSREFCELLRAMMHSDPEQRPTAAEILLHRVLTEQDLKSAKIENQRNTPRTPRTPRTATKRAAPQ